MRRSFAFRAGGLALALALAAAAPAAAQQQQQQEQTPQPPQSPLQQQQEQTPQLPQSPLQQQNPNTQGQGTDGPAGGAPSVQSVVPEVGSGRGGMNNQVPESTERQAPTGGERPAPIPEQAAPTPTAPVIAPPPVTARGNTSADELELQRTLRGGVIDGRVSIPNQSAGILVQPDGRDWRQFRNRWLFGIGAVAVLGTIAILAAFYLISGQKKIEAGRSGRTIQRFTTIERVNHWMVAVSFVLLGLSGLNITYGALVLRPIIGAEAFTALTYGAQAVHQYLSFPFVLGLLGMVVLWLRDNLPRKVDVDWIKAGGPVAKGHPPAGKFNAAQKALYFFTMGGGALVAISGYLLMFPLTVTDVIGQQWAHIVHGLMAMVMIAAILGHIYIGSIGMEGAFEAMSTGRVDYNWAKEHHSVWLEEEAAKARQIVAPPAGARAAGAD
jgi:formate dehydrogenase subunit gamma